MSSESGIDYEKIVADDIVSASCQAMRKVSLPINERYTLTVLESQYIDSSCPVKVHTLRLFQYLFGDARGHELYQMYPQTFIPIYFRLDRRHGIVDPAMLKGLKGAVYIPRFVCIITESNKDLFTRDEQKKVIHFNEREWTGKSIFEYYIFQFVMNRTLQTFDERAREAFKSFQKFTDLQRLSKSYGLDVQTLPLSFNITPIHD